MQRGERLVRHTAEEPREMVRRGEDETCYAHLDAMTAEELGASIDPEEGLGSGPVLRGFPQRKREGTVEIGDGVNVWLEDPDDGPGPRIDAVPRGSVEAQRWEEWTRRPSNVARARKGEAA